MPEVLEEEKEPFDAIHVGAAAATLPDILVEKLARGGLMVSRNEAILGARVKALRTWRLGLGAPRPGARWCHGLCSSPVLITEALSFKPGSWRDGGPSGSPGAMTVMVACILGILGVLRV